MQPNELTFEYLPVRDKTISLTPSTGGKVNCKIKYYPDNQIKISCFSKPVYNLDREKAKKAPPETIWNTWTQQYDSLEAEEPEALPKRDKPKKPRENRTDNIRRAIDKAFEIGLANDFRYFITLTLDPSKIDRYDKEIIYPKLRVWLSNMVQRNAMDYIVFPEYHKLKFGETDRAIHFHGLANAEGLTLADSGRRTKAGQTVYNLSAWKYGFSTAIELDGRAAVVRYVTKYITKDNEKILGKHYLSGGKTLQRELRADYVNISYHQFDGKEYPIPEANMTVKYKTLEFGPKEEWEDEDVLEVPDDADISASCFIPVSGPNPWNDNGRG